MTAASAPPYAFISYASVDAPRALPVVAALERAGVPVWVDRGGIPGGASYAAAIAAAIKGAAAFVLLASPASLASRNVRQELALGWRYERPYLPLLLDPVTIPDELAYWLEAAQWVEVLGHQEATWLPAALTALHGLGVTAQGTATVVAIPPAAPAVAPPPDPIALPVTRYARSGDLSIAYQVVGDGPLDLVHVPGFISHVEHIWEQPLAARFYARLAAISRLILFDKRGTGLSDRVATVATLEERMDDIRAVMDAAGSERAVLFGVSEGTALAALFAATYPERAAGLIIYGGMASYVRRPDYPWRPPEDEVRRTWIDEPAQTIHQTWGTTIGFDEAMAWGAPSLVGDEAVKRWLAANMRLAVSPGAEIARRRMNIEIDIRPILPTIRVPTTVLHRIGDRDENVEEGRYLAAHIPGATFVELPGVDHLWWAGDSESILASIADFIANLPAAAPDFVLATVLCCRVTAPADQPAPPSALDQFRTLAQRDLDRHRGNAGGISAAPDSLIATFDGPARAIRCALALVGSAASLGLAAQAGVHTGECALGNAAVTGPAVDVATAIIGHAVPGEVLVSGTAMDLVPGAGLHFTARGTATLAGQSGELPLFRAN